MIVYNTLCTKLLPFLVCFMTINLRYWDAILKSEKRIFKYTSSVFKFIFHCFEKKPNCYSFPILFLLKKRLVLLLFSHFLIHFVFIQEMYEETTKTTMKLALKKKKISSFFPRIELHVYHNFVIFFLINFFFNNSFIGNVPVLWLLC